MADSIRDLFFGTPANELVEAIEPRRTFDDVVLPETTLRQLNHALALVRKHDLIFRQWGLAERHTSGLGLAFHFAGPPGTGKTICAEALAYALDQRLLVVRYSELESRWVGQTAKHVASVFRAAERQNAVLFFDEADAIAGRRFTSLSAAYEREERCALWMPLVRAPGDPARLGPFAWKPRYDVVPARGAEPVHVLPGHFGIFEPEALRLRLAGRLLDLGYRTRNRSIGYRRAVILRAILSSLLAQDLGRLARLRRPDLTVTVVGNGWRLARDLRAGRPELGELERMVARVFLRAERRAAGEVARLPVLDLLRLAEDVDTEEEARAMRDAGG